VYFVIDSVSVTLRFFLSLLLFLKEGKQAQDIITLCVCVCPSFQLLKHMTDFSTVSDNNMVDRKTCEVGVTLTPLNIYS